MTAEKQRWVARVEFEDAEPGVIHAALDGIQQVLVNDGLGRIKKVTFEDPEKRHRSAFDRAMGVLVEMHRGIGLPHPMSWNTVSKAPAEDGSGVWDVMESAVAVTTDPDDARLLTALTQIVWTKQHAKQRLRELILAYIQGDDPGAVIRGLGSDPDPGLDVGVVYDWFRQHMGPAEVPSDE